MYRHAGLPKLILPITFVALIKERICWEVNTEKFEGEGWRTLWIAIVGVMAITLTWNVLMVSLNGISY